ncbi:uncharacterized protein LODBEIA_P22550 [Lodderomyces beijingensis]|uniref:Uncharacterized protein n=1 Tax=Lodderomyces beijingensis TaxID=1775926 RepID=A0ABP0ZLP4_9ASCO
MLCDLLILYILSVCNCAFPQLNEVRPTRFVDLDEEEANSQINLSNVTFYTIEERESLTPQLLESLFYHNPKTVIYIEDSNTTIVPIDDVLKSTDARKFKHLEYVEVKHNFLEPHYKYIPISPCISSRAFGLEGPLMGIATTYRVGLSARFSGSTGITTNFGYLINTTTIGFTLMAGTKVKLASERAVDSFAACYSTQEEAARLFGYVPIWTTALITRKIIYRFWRNRPVSASAASTTNGYFNSDINSDPRPRSRVVISSVWKPSKPRSLIGKGPVTMVCDVGTRKHLQCGSNKGKIIDEYGNNIFWSNEQ